MKSPVRTGIVGESFQGHRRVINPHRGQFPKKTHIAVLKGKIPIVVLSNKKKLSIVFSHEHPAVSTNFAKIMFPFGRGFSSLPFYYILPLTHWRPQGRPNPPGEL